MSQHAKTEIVIAMRELLKISKKSKRELFNLLSNRFTRQEVERAIEMALRINVIKSPSLIKPRNHEQIQYVIV